jgi:predicted phosphate transport protein (TIGR00153 family)
MGLREWIIPQDKAFFDVLERESENVVRAAEELEETIKKFDMLEERRKRMKEVEHTGDEIVHEIYEKLNKSFITPIDREDITRLASLYDDVLDFMYAVVNRIVLYEINQPTVPMIKFSEIVRESVQNIHQAFLSMRKLQRQEIDSKCIEVDRLENEADTLLNESVASLFKEKDVIRILKLKEIYEYMETVTDKCEDVSFVLRDVIMKYT